MGEKTFTEKWQSCTKSVHLFLCMVTLGTFCVCIHSFIHLIFSDLLDVNWVEMTPRSVTFFIDLAYCYSQTHMKT